MKKLILALAAVIVTVASYGQGAVVFATRVAGSHNAPATLDAAAAAQAGRTAGAPAGSISGNPLTAQLFLVGSGGTLTALTPPTRFNSGSANPLLDQYVIPVDVVVPGVAPGANATLRVRAWSGNSFEEAQTSGYFGQSNDITIALGGGTLPPANLTGLTGFSVTFVPEPSTLTLGVLGAAALLLRRRK